MTVLVIQRDAECFLKSEPVEQFSALADLW